MIFNSNKFLLIISLLLISCNRNYEAKPLENIKIAFMSDIHLQDIYATFSDTEYKGIKNPVTGKYNTIRTMEAQLHSTRLFNENYFAFLAALDDAVKKGIKIIALPGDFTDDGQPMNVKALRQILETYSHKHGITFLITTGNHDPVRPVEQDSGKKDYLGEGGMPQPIMSREGYFKTKGLAPIITKDVKEWGYDGILNELSDFGFFPNKNFLYWKTPFSTYHYSNYSFQKAQEAADLHKRKYAISDYLTVPDASYLVEPQEGIWLLAIDANVYIPKKDADTNSNDPSNYQGASIGYNNVLTHKKHLIQWVAKVTKEAEEHGKTLIAFSHYPMVDFNDDTSELKKVLFGSDKMQLHRVPKVDVAKAFANAGLKLHFGGHMHINDTGVHRTENGNTLINVQTPSLAAYPAAYKILTIQSKNIMEVETVPLKSVPRFKELFSLYEEEHEYLIKKGREQIWRQEILETNNYQEYVTWHLKELVRLRFIPNDWPIEFKEQFLEIRGKDLLERTYRGEDSLKIRGQLMIDNLTIDDLKVWNGHDMIFDFYRLHKGDHLAYNDIGSKRIKQYKILLAQLTKMEGSKMNNQLKDFAQIFQKHFEGMPSDYFRLDIKEGEIHSLSVK